MLRNGVVAAKDSARIVDYVEFEIDKSYILKADLMILDILAHNDWTRPVYFAVTVGNDSYLNLENYFQLEGLAYRFVPIKNTQQETDGQTGRVQTAAMYNNMMNKFMWGNMKDERVYLDQNNLNMTMNLRNNFGRLAEALQEEGEIDSSLKVLDRCNEVMPDKTVPYNVMMLRIGELYYRAAMDNKNPLDTLSITNSDVELKQTDKQASIDKGNAIVKRLADIYEDDLNYYFSLRGTSYFKSVDREMNQAMAIYQELIRLSKLTNQTAITADLEKRFKKLEERYTTN